MSNTLAQACGFRCSLQYGVKIALVTMALSDSINPQCRVSFAGSVRILSDQFAVITKELISAGAVKRLPVKVLALVLKSLTEICRFCILFIPTRNARSLVSGLHYYL